MAGPAVARAAARIGVVSMARAARGVLPMDGPVHARTIPELLEECAHRWRGRVAVLEDGHGTSYEQLHADVMSAADGLLHKGIRAGDRVGLWAPNSYRWVVASFGLHCIGAVVVPLNTRYRSPEAWDYLVRAGARSLLVADRFLGYEHLRTLEGEAGRAAVHLELVVDLAGPGGPLFGGRPVLSWDDLLAAGRSGPSPELRERMAAVRSDDLSDVIFTSGTSGRSKGVCLTHGAPLTSMCPTVRSGVCGLATAIWSSSRSSTPAGTRPGC